MPAQSLHPAAAVAMVAAGGALGAVLRYAISAAVLHLAGDRFPLGTLAVNVIGSLAIGVIVGAVASREAFDDWLRLFVMIGCLGSLTTFSTFSAETLRLLHEQRLALAAINVLASVALCLGAAALGYIVARRAG